MGLPQADFSGNPLSGLKPLSVTFTNTSISASTYFWKFGDGGTSTSVNPTHSYLITGSFTVILIASSSNGSGSINIKSNYVNVH